MSSFRINNPFESFTKKETYSSLINSFDGKSLLLKLNNSIIPVVDYKTSKTSSLSSEFNDFLEKDINISKYTTPTKQALNTFKKLGEDFDKSIEESFLGQVLHVKASDILCSSFCFILSLLPCKTKDALHLMLNESQKMMQATNIGINAFNNIVESASATVPSISAIKDNATNLFADQNSTEPTLNKINSAAILVASTINIANNIKVIADMLKLGLQYKIIMPELSIKTLWDLTNSVLFIVQTMAIQIADEILNKVVSEVERKLSSLVPQACFGTMATRLLVLIIDSIKTFKGYILSEIGDLFISNSDFNLKFQFGIKNSSKTLEILSFIKGFNMVAANFFEIARACGVSPCSQNRVININNLNLDDIGNLYFNDPNKIPLYMDKWPTNDIVDLDDINIDGIHIHITPDSLYSTFGIAKDAPKKIRDLINNGTLNNILDENYSIINKDNEVNVVYNYKRNCGEV